MDAGSKKELKRTTKTLDAENVGEAFLLLLAERGIDYFFANAGTDFAPIIEAYARSTLSGRAS